GHLGLFLPGRPLGDGERGHREPEQHETEQRPPEAHGTPKRERQDGIRGKEARGHDRGAIRRGAHSFQGGGAACWAPSPGLPVWPWRSRERPRQGILSRWASPWRWIPTSRRSFTRYPNGAAVSLRSQGRTVGPPGSTCRAAIPAVTPRNATASASTMPSALRRSRRTMWAHAMSTGALPP